ncbi:MAG TPA: hypothetical protein VKB88_34945 [Bryobacteraceae bacterium]|nr:hypothetical protein [Bryobacteraceae bacterium]
MSAAAIQLVHRNPTAKRRRRPPEPRRVVACNTALQLSTTPLSDPVEILRQMPAQAVTPALLEMLDLLSSPFLLIENSPTGELREAAAAGLMLAMAA